MNSFDKAWNLVKEIKDDQAAKRRDGTAITPETDLLRLPPNERKNKFVAGILMAAGMMMQGGEGDFNDSDDEFGFLVARAAGGFGVVETCASNVTPDA